MEEVQKKIIAKGYRVAAIKHSHHDFDMDQPGKDSWRFGQAGSNPVALSSPHKLAVFESMANECTLSRIAALFEGKADIVLAEGYKSSHYPKILILNPEQEGEHLPGENNVILTVSPYRSWLGELVFRDNDVNEIVNLLIVRINDSLHRYESIPQLAEYIVRDDNHQTERFERLLAESEAFHGHICPGQVLGVRMAMRGCQELGIANPKEESKRLVVYVEIDRCATDAIQVVTGCKMGKRTLKYADYGKMAATFVDLRTGNAVRIVAREDSREKAARFPSQGRTKYEIQVDAYKAMPDEELFQIERVKLRVPPEDMPGPTVRRVLCEECGEGINDCREVIIGGRVLCRACAYGRYYKVSEKSVKEQPALVESAVP
jgi:formylmethanofuran dehydrogenase subunit E